jgi:hypothetical protein
MERLTTILITDDDIAPSLPPSTQSFTQHFDKVDYFDNAEIRKFLKINFDSDVLAAYETLTPYACKKDLASYAIIYKNGGWFSDISNTFLVRPAILEFNNSLIFFRDRQVNSKTSWAVQNSLFYFPKEHPILLEAMTQVLRNVATQYYGLTPLSVSATSVFGRAIATFGETSEMLIGTFAVEDEQAYFQLPKKIRIAKYKEKLMMRSGLFTPGWNDYTSIWNSRNVYGEKTNK